MIARIRLLVLVARPAVLLLLGLYAATGTARAGRGEDHLLLSAVLLAVTAVLLFSVAVNDLADEAIDRVNLLATDGGHRRDERLISATAIVGRGLLVVLLVALSGRHELLMAALTALFAAQAALMAVRGPLPQYSRHSMTTARSSPRLVGTSRTRNAAPPR